MLPSRSFQLISITSLILLAIASPANAQRLSIGGRLGLDFARLDLPSGAGLDTRTGFSVGGFVGYHLSKRFAVQPELSFVTKGAESAAIFISYHEGTPPELNPLVTNVQIDYKLSYLELQVPLTLMIPAGSAALAPRLYLGPSLAVEVGCETGAKCREQPLPRPVVSRTPSRSTSEQSLARVSTPVSAAERSPWMSGTTWAFRTSTRGSAAR